MAQDVVISVRDLGKRYRLGGQPRARYLSLRESLADGAWRVLRRGPAAAASGAFWAIKDVSFDVTRGDVVGIVGRNGAGKSTLLKILSRVTEPTQGEARLRGRVGSLLEVGTGFHPELTGRENVFLNGAILGMGRAEIQRKFDEIVAFAEVERFLDTQVKHYSSGMYMRLAFSVAAHLDPDILIVDEVLAVGDAQFQKKCVDRMEAASRQGRTVLFVSHNLGSISALCNRCILMAGGQVAMIDETQKVIAAYNNLAQKYQTVEIDASMRNRGDGSVVFERCSISDLSGAPKNSFLIGEDVCIDIEFRSNYRGSASFWLIIFDAGGRPLLSTHQRDREWVRMDEGRFRMRYRTEHLGLMPGNYAVAAGVFDPTLRFLEWIDNCQSFEVYPSFLDGTAFDSRWGAVNQRANWEVTPL